LEYADEALKAVYFLIRLYIIYLVFIAARHFAKRGKGTHWNAYLWTFAVIIGFTLFSSYALGTHIEDSDAIYGGGETVTDYEPTGEQRIKHGIFIFTALIVPAVIGTNKGLREREQPILTDGSNPDS